MKKVLFILVAGILLFAACGSDDSTPISYSAGDAVEHTVNTVSFYMHLVPSGGPFDMGCTGIPFAVLQPLSRWRCVS